VAGGFLYIVAIDFLLELRKQIHLNDSVLQVMTVPAGLTLMSALHVVQSW